MLSDLFKEAAPSFVSLLLPLFESHFFLSEAEIIEVISQTKALQGHDSRKLNLFGFVNSQGQEVPVTFYHDLKSKGLRASLLDLTCSLKVENVHLLSPTMKKFVASFFRGYEIPISVNMYITPRPEAPCFKPHADFTEVFIYQLLGTKSWTFFCDDQGKYLAGEEDQALLKGDALERSHKKNHVVKLGDVLHIPPLLYHEACSLDGPSIHLTVSLNRLRAEHVLRVYESALLEMMNIPKHKNLDNDEFEMLFLEADRLTQADDFKALLKTKKEQMLFLSKTQILLNGR